MNEAEFIRYFAAALQRFVAEVAEVAEQVNTGYKFDPGQKPLADCLAGPGFASIRWGGEIYRFGGNLQRCIIGQLWRAWEEGMPDVPEKILLEKADSDSEELRLLFRGHPAWGKIIVRSALFGGPHGCYRLLDATDSQVRKLVKAELVSVGEPHA